jgi:transposase InsO family protein
MHKNTKLTSNTRREMYAAWCRGGTSFRSLGTRYRVDKNVVRTVVGRGRAGDFTVHDSANRRYRCAEYGLRRLAATGARMAAEAERRVRRGRWTDRDEPGELVHADSRRLPRTLADRMRSRGGPPPEHLFVAVDDCTRWLFADVLPDRSGDSGAAFVASCAMRLPFRLGILFSDNGGEFRGNDSHPVASLCASLGVRQKFTRPRHPWTNGKAERVIRTLLEEWLSLRDWPDRASRRRALYECVDRYNHRRRHMAIGDMTPAQKLSALLVSGDNAC